MIIKSFDVQTISYIKKDCKQNILFLIFLNQKNGENPLIKRVKK
ncbi:hypothetical protein RV09_GL000765 [Enterococcus moraviensis]|nr:hypothetical protein RV09_GL000765 [Enterococcus moraviensis]